MLEDFIESNSLNARLFHFRKSNESSASCKLFIPRNGFPVLVVKLAKDKINAEKLQKAIAGIYQEATEENCLSITGCSLEYLPPISIYGMVLLLDKKAAQHDLLLFATAEEQTLEISPKEILELNEESKIADIT
ncbi:MAG: hypothetical protein COT15_04180 [Candidatus Diapherotrites archaeon CG08_land_8_20_14_0_20_34_12]|nr:MAG: hypothetical protein COT15_04180 [Candidatus Diapherotrites archaeon CG08_land_8_20_14_0_20_34_12]